jgi:phosphoglycolate phosphatase-like HAD superfamily hydrolase
MFNKHLFRPQALGMAAALLATLAIAEAVMADPLPSWNEGRTKSAIGDFIARTTNPRGRDFVPQEDRIATFDNDGTLWSEQPVYFQMAFVFDRIRAMAKHHPEWQDQQPFKVVLDNDLQALAGQGRADLAKLLAATSSGMTVDAFSHTVEEWIQTARHPRFGHPYSDLVFHPMLELLAHLRANGYRTYIVSGGGIEFIRPWSARLYGIPPEQVVGSSGKTAFRLRNGEPMIVKLPEIDFIDDGPGKPVGIHRFIGKRPIFAAGNSDGDLQMLQWTTLTAGPRMGILIHHTDGVREWAYDRHSPVGRLDKALDEAPARGWLIVDMKRDWRIVYPDGP